MITSDLERKKIEKAIELKALGYMISYLSDWLTVFKVVDATECKTELEHAYQRGRYDAFSMALEAAMRTQTEILMEGVHGNGEPREQTRSSEDGGSEG